MATKFAIIDMKKLFHTEAAAEEEMKSMNAAEIPGTEYAVLEVDDGVEEAKPKKEKGTKKKDGA
jgi:hypothetical protein